MKKITTLLLSLFTLFNVNATTHYVDAFNYGYSPSSLTINQGDTVTWINTAGFHDVNGDVNSLTGSSFNNPVSFYLSPVTSPDTIGSYVFQVPGVYDYDCSIGNHAAAGMVASITVTFPNSCTISFRLHQSFNYRPLDCAILMEHCLDLVLTVFTPQITFNNLPSGTLTAIK